MNVSCLEIELVAGGLYIFLKENRRGVPLLFFY
jgi:hypothetical protein